MTETETVAPLIDLEEEDLQQLGNVYGGYNIYKREAVKFGNRLFTYQSIKEKYGDPPIHSRMKNDKKLIEFFAGNFGLFLPNTMEGSEYGVFKNEKGDEFEVATDFVLAQWDRKRLQTECITKGFSLEVFEKAYKQLNNLKARLTRMAKGMIDEFQYQGKPIKPAAEALTQKALKAQNDEKLRKLIVSFPVSRLIYKK
jgi:hypothetical protein